MLDLENDRFFKFKSFMTLLNSYQTKYFWIDSDIPWFFSKLALKVNWKPEGFYKNHLAL